MDNQRITSKIDFGTSVTDWLNPPVGPPTEGDQGNQANAAYEAAMKEAGNETWLDKNTSSDHVADRQAHFSLLRTALPLVAEGIKSTLKQAKGAKGRPPLWVTDLSGVDPSTLSYIGLMCCFNNVLRGQSIANLTQSIGKLVEQELLKVELLAADDLKHALLVDEAAEAGLERPKKLGTNKRLITQVTKAHNSREYRLKALRIIATKNGFKSLNFGIVETKDQRHARKERLTKNAAPIISAVLEHSGLFDRTTESQGVNNSVSKLLFTKEAEAELEKSERYLSWMAPIYKPMLAEPKPWSTFDTGCYHDDFLASTVKLIRQAPREQEKAVEHALTKGIPTYVKALNALQATPLSINEPILEAVQWCWDHRKAFGKFPTVELPQMPRMPEDHASLDVEVKAAIKEDIRDFFKLVTQVKGSAEVMRQDLQTAHELAVHDKFYLPMNLDFRGRFYAIPNFNYHRDDHIKALFMYHRGYLVDGNNAFWLKVHLANVGDFDKISKQSLDDRAEWVDDHHDQILATADNYREAFVYGPTLGFRFIEADKPFQFLAACFEYKRLVDEGDNFVGYVPYSLDGTNSGVQQYSGASLSEAEGTLVNLVPSDTMADVYAVVAKNVSKELLSIIEGPESQEAFDLKRDNSPTMGTLATLWLGFGITRTLLKRPTMTYGYSSKAIGMAGQFMEDFMKPLQRAVAYGRIPNHPIAKTEDERFTAARFLAKISFEAIEKTLPKVAKAMKYLQRLAEVLSRENKAIKWNTPSGFPIVQAYRKRQRKEIKIFLFDRAAGERKRTKVSLSEELPEIDVRKSVSAIAPNFVHGLDSSQMALCICHLLDTGAAEDFFMIHDSFSISGDMWDLYHGVRHSFVEMYKDGCVFQKFEDQVRQQLNSPTTELPPIPEKGTLDIEGVRDSQYCFS